MCSILPHLMYRPATYAIQTANYEDVFDPWVEVSRLEDTSATATGSTRIQEATCFAQKLFQAAT